ncbi:hypothetical protein CASFOL_000879 [Castilleja foliolosa]|uniref:Uncharacterized protein n=1 Tax=Castilleja foliolosa TaxID=1961234 RepID=A0ABD3EKZ7_9LAMI
MAAEIGSHNGESPTGDKSATVGGVRATDLEEKSDSGQRRRMIRAVGLRLFFAAKWRWRVRPSTGDSNAVERCNNNIITITFFGML